MTTYRVLKRCFVNSRLHQPGAVVEADAGLAKSKTVLEVVEPAKPKAPAKAAAAEPAQGT